MNSQYLLASSFGPMQVGMINWLPLTAKAYVMTGEHDLSAPYPDPAVLKPRILQLVRRPDTGVRVGAAEDMYHLYSKDKLQSSLQTNCQETCDRQNLRTAVANMLHRYNGAADYSAWVARWYCATAPQPLTWVGLCQ